MKYHPLSRIYGSQLTHAAAIAVSAMGALSLTGSPAHAGGNGSHGGNAVVCFDRPGVVQEIMAKPLTDRMIPPSALPRITLIRMLDLYQAKSRGSLDLESPRQPKYFEPSPGETNEQYIERQAERFDRYSPYFSKMLREGYTAFSGKVFERTDTHGLAGISQVKDYGNLSFQIDRTKCLIATLAHQNAAGELEVDGRLYRHPKHSELSRKTLVVHEIVYLKGIELDHHSSDPTRALTALIMQKEVSRNELVDELYRGGFGKLKDHGTREDDQNVEFHQALYGELDLISAELNAFLEKNSGKADRSIEEIKYEHAERKRSVHEVYRPDSCEYWAPSGGGTHQRITCKELASELVTADRELRKLHRGSRKWKKLNEHRMELQKILTDVKSAQEAKLAAGLANEEMRHKTHLSRFQELEQLGEELAESYTKLPSMDSRLKCSSSSTEGKAAIRAIIKAEQLNLRNLPRCDTKL